MASNYKCKPIRLKLRSYVGSICMDYLFVEYCMYNSGHFELAFQCLTDEDDNSYVANTVRFRKEEKFQSLDHTDLPIVWYKGDCNEDFIMFICSAIVL